MTAGWSRLLAVCALLVLAGCAAPVADDPVAVGGGASQADSTPGSGTTDTGSATSGEPEGVLVDGDVDVDANRTYDRVRDLLGVDYAGTRVVVRDLSQYNSADYSGVPFFWVFGISNPELDADGPAGVTTLDATVYVSPADADATAVEQVLAHEFVHVAQVRTRMVPWFGAVSLGRVTLDEQLARRALVEGGAVYVTDAYTREFLPESADQSEQVAAGYENGSSGDRLVWSQYHFGFRYVDATVDDPGDLAAVYEDAPDTTENVLDPGERDERAALDVDVDAEAYTRVDSRTVRVGELVTRVLLRDATDEATAVNASDGWGNDRVVAFSDGESSSIAWVTRWDSSRDADEFAAAAGELDDRPATDSAYRVDRLDSETVVVFAGEAAFVETADASGNVTITA